MSTRIGADDPLGETLHHLHLSGVMYSQCEFTEPWGLELPELPGKLMFHVVTSGECWIEIDGFEPRLLAPGDLALVPHGDGHRLVSGPGVSVVKLFDLSDPDSSLRYEILRQGGGGPQTSVICTTFSYDEPMARNLISVLPRCIVLDASSGPHAAWVLGALEVMSAESRGRGLGGEVVVSRLADILLIQAIRIWIERDDAGEAGWLSALRDARIGRAIALVHREPERSWSVASLADEVAMSRSAFAGRFTQIAGETPMQFVTRWRMQCAEAMLRQGDTTVSELAGRLGYRSDAAFSRAFKRQMGVSPGSIR